MIFQTLIFTKVDCQSLIPAIANQTLTGERLRDNPPKSKLDPRVCAAGAGSTAQPRQPARQSGGAPGTGGGRPLGAWMGPNKDRITTTRTHRFASPRAARGAARSRATRPNRLRFPGWAHTPNLRYLVLSQEHAGDTVCYPLPACLWV